MTTRKATLIFDIEACKTWLETVRTDGPGFIVNLYPKKGAKEFGFQNHDDAANVLGSMDAAVTNICITPSRFFSTDTRKAVNAKDVKSIFIDVDCGEGKAYPNKKTAFNALLVFCKNIKLPEPSLIINSGWGLHVYWCFERPISKDCWKNISNKLKGLAVENDFRIDKSVMADPARIMRVPGSFNLKVTDNPKPVKIRHPKHGKPKRYKFEEFQQGLDKAVASQSTSGDVLTVSKNLLGITAPDTFPEGLRNSGLLSHAGHLRKAGLTQAKIESELLAINATGCKPPLTDDEVLSISRRYQTDSSEGAQQPLFNGESNPSVMSESQMIDALNHEFAWDLSQMQLYSIKTGRYVQKPNFVTQYSNKRVNKGTMQEPKLVELGKHWLSHPNRRDVPKVVMEPGKPSTLLNGAINGWRGLSCEPVSGDIGPFEKLLKHLITSDTEREYVLLWLASLIKNPAAKFNVALVVWSYLQGTGKSLLFESIGRLFDSLHFGVVGLEVFTDGFTDWQANKVFVICDEVSSTGTRGAADRVKGWVTAQTNRINVKHEPKFEQPNLIKYVFLSNHPDAVFMEANDRRFFVVEASQERLPSQQAKEYLQWFDNDGQSALLSYLLSIDTTSFNPAAPAPLTRSKQEMIDDNKSDLDRWLDAKLPELEDCHIELVSADLLSSEYAMSIGSPCSGRAVGLSLKKRGFTKLHKQARFQDGKRKRLYASKNVSAYECLSDGDLASIYEEQYQSKSKKHMHEHAYSTGPQVV